MFGRLNNDDVIDVVPLKEIVTVKDVSQVNDSHDDIDVIDNQSSGTRTKVVIQIETVPDGYNSGRVYRMKVKSPKDFDTIVRGLSTLASAARERAEAKNKFRKSQDYVRRIFTANVVQRILAALIAAVNAMLRLGLMLVSYVNALVAEFFCKRHGIST